MAWFETFPDGTDQPTLALIWAGRILGTAILLVLGGFALAHLFSPEPEPGPVGSEWVALALFPTGLLAGYVLAWFNARVGGWTSLICMVLFSGWMLIERDLADVTVFWIFAIPAVLLVIGGTRLQRATPLLDPDSMV